MEVIFPVGNAYPFLMMSKVVMAWLLLWEAGVAREKLDEIAARCGYRDTAYFCRVFKRLAKVTPAEYRGQRKSNPMARGGVAPSRVA